MNLAIIPARGGSKRIPRKNIRLFAGKPVIAWSIEAALASRCFDRVIVSTNDLETAAIARKYGAEVPFLRPEDLSDDHTGTIPVVRHAIEETGGAPAHQLVCCIYATAPFITAELLSLGRDVLLDSGADYAISVTSYPFPIQRAVRRTAGNRIEMFYPEYFSTRSQDLEEAFHDAGQFYWGRSEAWLSDKGLFGHDTAPVIVPRHQVQDIDTEEDWVRAEWLFRAMQAESGSGR
jgi:pseudaminic acid cytidylyltransferase